MDGPKPGSPETVFVQQLLGVPLVIVFSLIYWKVSDRNV